MNGSIEPFESFFELALVIVSKPNIIISICIIGVILDSLLVSTNGVIIFAQCSKCITLVYPNTIIGGINAKRCIKRSECLFLVPLLSEQSISFMAPDISVSWINIDGGIIGIDCFIISSQLLECIAFVKQRQIVQGIYLDSPIEVIDCCFVISFGSYSDACNVRYKGIIGTQSDSFVKCYFGRFDIASYCQFNSL